MDCSTASSVGVDFGLLGVHCGLRDLIYDATMKALFNQKEKDKPLLGTTRPKYNFSCEFIQ
jgi:hypothetical protein